MVSRRHHDNPRCYRQFLLTHANVYATAKCCSVALELKENVKVSLTKKHLSTLYGVVYCHTGEQNHIPRTDVLESLPLQELIFILVVVLCLNLFAIGAALSQE